MLVDDRGTADAPAPGAATATGATDNTAIAANTVTTAAADNTATVATSDDVDNPNLPPSNSLLSQSLLHSKPQTEAEITKVQRKIAALEQQSQLKGWPTFSHSFDPIKF